MHFGQKKFLCVRVSICVDHYVQFQILTPLTTEIKTTAGVNTEGGALNFGVFNAPSPSKISLLIEASKALAEDSPEYHDLIEELDNYHKPRPGREIIGLENKLKNAEEKPHVSPKIPEVAFRPLLKKEK